MLPENQVTQDILPAKPELLGRAEAYLWAPLCPPSWVELRVGQAAPGGCGGSREVLGRDRPDL